MGGFTDILSCASSPRERLMGDILRVLGLSLGRLWLAELAAEIAAFRETLGFSEPTSRKELVDAVMSLAGLGLVTVEERIRATYSGGENDLLVGVVDFDELSNALMDDEAYNRYRSILDGIFGRG